MNSWKWLAATSALSMAAMAVPASAQAPATPVGLWKTIDDKSGTEKSLVRISESAGALVGRIDRLLDPTKQDAKCDKCSGALKGQPVLGMTIITGAKPSDDRSQWEGGEILDPNDGKVYKVRIRPVDGGKRLEVRGYIGAPLLGRTQTWLRVE